MQNAQEAINELIKQITDDNYLTEETKDSVIEVLKQCMDDPQPDNFKALAVLMDQLSRLHKYANAVDVVSGAN